MWQANVVIKSNLHIPSPEAAREISSFMVPTSDVRGPTNADTERQSNTPRWDQESNLLINQFTEVVSMHPEVNKHMMQIDSQKVMEPAPDPSELKENIVVDQSIVYGKCMQSNWGHPLNPSEQGEDQAVHDSISPGLNSMAEENEVETQLSPLMVDQEFYEKGQELHDILRMFKQATITPLYGFVLQTS
jgi:hypothetical protein